MSSPARDAILARLRAARPTTRIPRSEAPTPVAHGRRTVDECLQRFTEEARALGIDVWVEESPGGVRSRVAALTSGLRVLSWSPEHLPYDVGSVLDQATPGSADLEEQALAEVGITSCDAAIAETGSLAMLTGPGRSRTVSLLPPLHIVVITPAHLCYTMAEYFADRRVPIENSSSCTFITGPSRTADIELTLTLGIHGPGRVVVIVGP